MFIYIYQSLMPGKNKPMNRIDVVTMKLKSNTSSNDETKLNTPSVIFKRKKSCGSSKTWKKWGWRVSFHSIPPALHLLQHPCTAIPADGTAPLYEMDHTQTDRDTPAEDILQSYRKHGTGTKSGASR